MESILTHDYKSENLPLQSTAVFEWYPVMQQYDTSCQSRLFYFVLFEASCRLCKQGNHGIPSMDKCKEIYPTTTKDGQKLYRWICKLISSDNATSAIKPLSHQGRHNHCSRQKIVKSTVPMSSVGEDPPLQIGTEITTKCGLGVKRFQAQYSGSWRMVNKQGILPVSTFAAQNYILKMPIVLWFSGFHAELFLSELWASSYLCL